MELEGIHQIAAITAARHHHCDRLCGSLRLPEQHEHLRKQREQRLAPLQNSRPGAAAR